MTGGTSPETLLPAALLALSVAWSVGHLAVALGKRGLFLDVPNGRSLHGHPVPRAGGVAMLAGVSAGLSWLGSLLLPLPVVLALCLAAVSWLDDVRGLSVRLRLAAHIAAAAAFVWLAGFDAMGWAALLSLALIVWSTNLYNFMDGSDGLAGGMAVIGFGIYALAAWLAGDGALSSLCVLLAAAAAGFLVLNRPPARLFMGDAGSIPLGFLAAALGLSGWSKGLWPPLFPVLVFAPFLTDASVTLAKRWLGGRRIWQAHREHYYQRILRLGLGHRGTALAGYALMCVSAGLAMIAFSHPDAAWPLVLVWGGALAAVMRRIDRLWSERGETV